MKVCVIAQARLGSERLPGKVLKEVLGKPLLGYQCERLARSKKTDEIIIATTTALADDAIVEFCRNNSLLYFRGSEEDVLDRFYAAALRQRAEVVVRVTADCPLIDPEVLDRVIGLYLEQYPKFDYVSNVLDRTYPRGLDCEVFAFKCLEEAAREARLRDEREHVTPFIRTRPERYRLAQVTQDVDESRRRWTVDTSEDFELIKKILTALYPKNPHFAMKDVLELLDRHSGWEAINTHVKQKDTFR